MCKSACAKRHNSPDDELNTSVLLSHKLNKFTNWNYGVLTFYWLLCTANDHLQIEWLSIYLHDLAFGIILPCSVVVCLGFWSMSSVDPKMVRSEGFYKYIGKCPFWYSHGTHTLVLFLPILETWLGSASARVESLHIQEFFRADVSLVGAVVNWRKIHLYCGWALSYTCVVFYLGLRRSLWPYPFMHKLTLAGKILLGVALNFVGFACLFGVSKLYHFYVTTTLQPIVKPKELTLWDKMTLYLVY
ncbi:uncharacterized protein LOC134846593 [Symsagittifera roscoffensis]|uniref:uncharacterized protein LOC134846593 n=1 Tax=Symsagittifera roscoffensis TaxID=84072 RepID=UPI00307BBD2B